MLHKELVDKLSGSLGRSKSDINNLLEALGNVVKERCSELDSITVPRFGTIEAVKHNEEIVTHAETGTRTLMPPCVEVKFTPSNVLKKRLNQS
ncbi:MAG: HU family DNA-binding protein [Muribaculaceae bacterium]|nr:HU family DNA-binding protein [Muribaculaceae bacterium]MBQ2563468.1 HU family DNA-binding protein [Muribaculaceae bacterium]MBQ5408429.1 HU family DNA-binding protein [Muribaculaceae bacterium]